MQFPAISDIVSGITTSCSCNILCMTKPEVNKHTLRQRSYTLLCPGSLCSRSWSAEKRREADVKDEYPEVFGKIGWWSGSRQPTSRRSRGGRACPTWSGARGLHVTWRGRAARRRWFSFRVFFLTSLWTSLYLFSVLLSFSFRVARPLFGVDCQTISLPLHRWALDKRSFHWHRRVPTHLRSPSPFLWLCRRDASHASSQWIINNINI